MGLRVLNSVSKFAVSQNINLKYLFSLHTAKAKFGRYNCLAQWKRFRPSLGP